jgi:hypothetical protein
MKLHRPERHSRIWPQTFKMGKKCGPSVIRHSRVHYYYYYYYYYYYHHHHHHHYLFYAGYLYIYS